LPLCSSFLLKCANNECLNLGVHSISLCLVCLFVASHVVIEEADEFGEIDVAAGDDADDLAEWCVG